MLTAQLTPRTTKRSRVRETGFFYLRVSSALALCLFSVLLGVFAFTAYPKGSSTPAATVTGGTNSLNGVACNSASDCWAAGYYITPAGNYQTLIEHWNGAAWTLTVSQNVGVDSVLNDVTCSSSSQCWAVGSSYGGATA